MKLTRPGPTVAHRRHCQSRHARLAGAPRTAYCWGKVGGLSDTVTTTPSLVAGLEDVKQVVGGRFSSCVLSLHGLARCGSLGDSLESVADSIRFSRLSVGLHAACGFTFGGALFCWNEFPGTARIPVRVVMPQAFLIRRLPRVVYGPALWHSAA